MDFPNIYRDEIISLDYETSGLKYWQPDFRVFGVSVGYGDQSQFWDIRDTPGVVDWLKDLLPSVNLVVAQNAQFEYQCSRVLGMDPRRIQWYCTMVNECLINEHHFKYDLYSIAEHNGIESEKQIRLENIRSAMGWKDAKEVLERLEDPTIPKYLVSAYGSSDAFDALRIYRAQQPKIDYQELDRVVKLEQDVMPVIADMSWVGVRVNLEAAHAAIPALDDQQGILQDEIEQITGGSFNVNSSPQVRNFFKPESINKYQWKLCDGTIVGPTKGGKSPCLDQEALRTISHPLATKILALRKCIKLRDTFLKGHIIGSADENGYVHTQFNQTRTDQDAGTVTGRLSSTDPALQQITNRDKVNAEILRSMFFPDPGQYWMRSDCSQIDFRMAAHLINDPSIIAAYQNDPKTDYHQIISEMTGIPRNPAYAGAPNTKTLNLALCFGAGAGRAAKSMGMPYELGEYHGRMCYLPGIAAKELFLNYHKTVPGVKKFAKHAEALAKSTGYVRTAIGRRLRFPHGQGTHKVTGTLYQSYAADAHKLGLVAVDHKIRKEKLPARLMISVHDEIGVSMPNNMEMALNLTRAFTSPGETLRLRVPLLASTGLGANWWEASLNEVKST